MNSGTTTTQQTQSRSWIRGVNIGGWLLAERFITPYLFAITNCHLKGDFCWYPGQISAPPVNSPNHEYCNLKQCTPHLIDSAIGGKDFPTDEYTLSASFENKDIASNYFTFHWNNFVKKQDIIELNKVGVTHVRVPLPHYVLGDIQKDEPWVPGRWLYFVRFTGWCREYGIEVWVDVHTAPGSQNGFDNSGLLLSSPTCKNWSGSEENVKRSLKAVETIAQQIMDDSLQDVVTGFGLLNEPFSDCDPKIVRDFSNQAFKLVRDIMGEQTHVFISDMFNATDWNDGWWTDKSNTYLDSHYYHAFAEYTRELSPKQHIALVCARNARDTSSCCYQDQPKNQIPSQGIKRIIGEWSAAFDTLPRAKLKQIMQSIKDKGEAIEINRTISQDRIDFLKKFVKAQMVAYEAEKSGVSSGWFYWTLKTEGGAFSEWSFQHGIRQGWITLPEKIESSESIYGTCEAIAAMTKDDPSVVHQFPEKSNLPKDIWMGLPIDDDYVKSHAATSSSSNKKGTTTPISSAASSTNNNEDDDYGIFDDEITNDDDDDDTNSKNGQQERKKKGGFFRSFVLAFFCYGIWRVFFSQGQFRFGSLRSQYTSLDSSINV